MPPEDIILILFIGAILLSVAIALTVAFVRLAGLKRTMQEKAKEVNELRSRIQTLERQLAILQGLAVHVKPVEEALEQLRSRSVPTHAEAAKPAAPPVAGGGSACIAENPQREAPGSAPCTDSQARSDSSASASSGGRGIHAQGGRRRSEIGRDAAPFFCSNFCASWRSTRNCGHAQKQSALRGNPWHELVE
jgi:hypothetical protein